MFDWIECFCQDHQYTLAAIGAIGSMGAVIVALWYSYEAKSQNTKVRVKCTLRCDLQSRIGSNKVYYNAVLTVCNNSFFGVHIRISSGIKYGRGKGIYTIFPIALLQYCPPEFRFRDNIISLKRGESQNVVCLCNDTLPALITALNEKLTQANRDLAKRSFFGKFGNKLYLELSDGTKIKIDNRIPKKCT